MSYDFKISQGDFLIGNDGDLKKVENTEKLIQDMLKICITPMGSNVFFPYYGSPISKSMVGNALDIEFISTIASSQLQNSLEILMKLQREQAKRQKITPFEHISAIKRVLITRNQVDPRFFSVLVEVLTKALSSASAQFNVSPLL